MKCILRIGYTEILLPDDKGVGKIIEVLSKGVECRYRSWEKTFEIQDEIEVGLKVLPASTKFEVSEEMRDKMEESFATTGKSGARKTSRISGSSQLIMIEKKDRG